MIRITQFIRPKTIDNNKYTISTTKVKGKEMTEEEKEYKASHEFAFVEESILF